MDMATSYHQEGPSSSPMANSASKRSLAIRIRKILIDLSRREWWSQDAIALVTGANQGIGLQLVRELARRRITAILTSRDESKGREAIKQLRDEGLDPDGCGIVYHQLDIASDDSVREFLSWLSRSYGSIDILINNAGVRKGVSTMGLTPEGAKYVLDINYYGTKRMIDGMVALLKPGARIVNVSSKAGDLSYLNNEWRAKMDDVATLTPESIDEMLQQFLRAVEKGEIPSRGWPCLGPEISPSYPPELLTDYSISKLALNAYSRSIAGALYRDKRIALNSMCPGVTSTSMSHNNGHPVAMGADTAIWLALLPPGTPEDDLPHGRFFINRQDVGFSGLPVFLNGRFLKSLTEINRN